MGCSGGAVHDSGGGSKFISLAKVSGGSRSCSGMMNSRRMNKRFSLFWMPGQRDGGSSSGILGMMIIVASGNYPVRWYEQVKQQVRSPHDVEQHASSLWLALLVVSN